VARAGEGDGMSRLQRLDEILHRHPRDWPLAIRGVLTLLAIGIVAAALLSGNPGTAALFLSLVGFSLWGLYRNQHR
jgi:hypothetical protein